MAVDDVERLIDEADTASDRRALALRDLAMVETAYAAGLRISELAAARLADLDLARGELRVTGQGAQGARHAARRTGTRGARRLHRQRPAVLRTATAAPRRRPGHASSSTRNGAPLASAACVTASIG